MRSPPGRRAPQRGMAGVPRLVPPLWADPREPSKQSLDAVYPDRPVAMTSGDLHTLWLNSKGLERLGLTPDSIPRGRPLRQGRKRPAHRPFVRGRLRRSAAQGVRFLESKPAAPTGPL